MRRTGKLVGLALSQISTPLGLIQLNRNGEATISGRKLLFIEERIAQGGLPGYTLTEDGGEPEDKTPGAGGPGINDDAGSGADSGSAAAEGDGAETKGAAVADSAKATAGGSADKDKDKKTKADTAEGS
ncbi:hypothetical protein CEK71_13485 [Methylovulum psychrotolerans]|uniref:Uncharacterized protein n=2 Tax=Methylovulum psychrotolerans TaxID=1704499 RepID=A0A1Z4C0H1_9GAMM|nr:hypothetical protein CEK71_13485 [Methylovulum psychrotolerans]